MSFCLVVRCSIARKCSSSGLSLGKKLLTGDGGLEGWGGVTDLSHSPRRMWLLSAAECHLQPGF